MRVNINTFVNIINCKGSKSEPLGTPHHITISRDLKPIYFIHDFGPQRCDSTLVEFVSETRSIRWHFFFLSVLPPPPLSGIEREIIDYAFERAIP